MRVRIDPQIKEEAAAVLAAIGHKVSDALHLLLTRVAREEALPFALLIPNEETTAAIKEARKVTPPQFKDINDLIDELNKDE